MSGPVTLTRCPTCDARCEAFAVSSRSIAALCFLKKPDFQLRDFGASVPSVSFSTNPLSARCRQPVTDTGFTAATVVVSAGFADAVVVAAGAVVAADGASGFIAAVAAGVAACGALDESRTANHSPPAAITSISIAI